MKTDNLDGVSVVNGTHVLHWRGGGEAVIELPIGPSHTWYHPILQSLSGRIVPRDARRITTRKLGVISVRPLELDHKESLLNWLLDNPPSRDHVISDWHHKVAVRHYKRSLQKLM